jgi:PP-loop superfamily ATP-utilizing enzyme
MDYATGTMCARCRIRVDQIADCLGESGLYSPNRAFTLCEPCFLEEESEIDERGTNDIPERIEAYRRNLRMGSLDFRSSAARCLVAVGSPAHPEVKP